MREEIYFRLVLSGARTIDQVPEDIREVVQARVDNLRNGVFGRAKADPRTPNDKEQEEV